MALVPKTTYQTISMDYPSERADDAALRLSFALDVRNNTAIGLSGGGVWKGLRLIGSFDGFVGFAHNVTGDDAEAVTALLAALSSDLTEAYGVPPVTAAEPEDEPQEEGGE